MSLLSHMTHIALYCCISVITRPQSVLGALIAVNLKNTLLQLSDPFYMWKKNRLDCVS